MFTTSMFAQTTGNYGPSEKEENGKRKKKGAYNDPGAAKKICTEKSDEETPANSIITEADKINAAHDKGIQPNSTYEEVLSHMLYKVNQKNEEPMEF